MASDRPESLLRVHAPTGRVALHPRPDTVSDSEMTSMAPAPAFSCSRMSQEPASDVMRVTVPLRVDTV